jgi:hypothetical protein
VRTFTAKLFQSSRVCETADVRASRYSTRGTPDIRYTHAQRTALFDFCQDFRNLVNFRHGKASASRNKRTRRSGSRCPDLLCRLAIYRFMQSPGEVDADKADFTLLIRTVGVFEEFLVLRYEPV